MLTEDQAKDLKRIANALNDISVMLESVIRRMNPIGRPDIATNAIVIAEIANIKDVGKA